MNDYVYLGLIFTSVGFIYIAYRQYRKTINLLETGLRADAKVVDMTISRRRKNYYYTPVFEYVDNNDKVITYKSNISTSPAAYKIGQTVQVVYSKDSDEKKIISYWGLYRWTVVLLCFAVPLLIIGLGYFLYNLN